jgi:regulatory factor X
MLMGDQNRDQMWADWKRLVNVKRIIENELPHGCGHEEAYNILTNEIRTMLLPLKTEMWLPDGTYYQEPAQESPDLTNETVIDRIAAFLTKLPSRFPHAPARTILHCVSAIGSAAMREITVENGQSFQGWWLTKVFIDEMGQWLASLGGFLAHNPPNWSPMSYSPGLMAESNTDIGNERSGSNNDSRYSSIDAEFAPTQNESFLANSNGPMSVVGESNANTQSKCLVPFALLSDYGQLTNRR